MINLTDTFKRSDLRSLPAAIPLRGVRSGGDAAVESSMQGHAGRYLSGQTLDIRSWFARRRHSGISRCEGRRCDPADSPFIWGGHTNMACCRRGDTPDIGIDRRRFIPRRGRRKRRHPTRRRFVFDFRLDARRRVCFAAPVELPVSHDTRRLPASLSIRRIPDVGDHIEVDGWRFEIVDLDGRRIDKLLAQDRRGFSGGEA